MIYKKNSTYQPREILLETWKYRYVSDHGVLIKSLGLSGWLREDYVIRWEIVDSMEEEFSQEIP